MERSLLYHLLKCQRNYSITSSTRDIPRITVPHKMVNQINKAKAREATKTFRKQRLNFKSPVVISCKRESYNHHKGQTYSGFSPQVLASHGWKSKGSAGDHFTLTPYAENPSIVGEERDFTAFDLHDGLQQGVRHLGFHHPTLIQNKAIPKILERKNVLCAAETGSGKTLAYLIPALQHVYQEQQVTGDPLPPNCPRTLILTPSRELADQIYDVCQQLSSHAGFTAHRLCGGRGTKNRLAWRERGVMDVLIATPGVLKKFVSSGQMHGRFLQHVILDEADSLLDDSFNSLVSFVLNNLQVSSSGDRLGNIQRGETLFTLVSATMPRSLDDTIGDTVPVESLARVTTDHLHHLMPHVPQTFLRLKPSQKAEMAVQLTGKNHHNGVPTLVFCNRSSASFWLSDLLKENNIPNGVLNGAIQEKRRNAMYNKFLDGKLDVMVATDIASRGLDLTRVGHVINFDFPHYISDYIHRVGRVGRVGSAGTGRVTSFISHMWNVDLLWQIETAARKHEALHNVNANIKRKIDSIVAKKYPKSIS